MTARRWIAPVVVAAAFAGGALTLFAEDLDLPKLLDSVKSNVQEKRYGKALADLQLVVGEVGRLRMESLKGVLPKPPEGWTAGEPEGEVGGALAMMGGGTQVKRQYHKGEDVSVDVELIADAGPWLAALQAMLTNPYAVQGNNQVVTVKQRRALLEYDKNEKSGTLQIMLNSPNSLLKLQGHGVAKADLVDVLGGAVDFDALEKALQN